MGRWFCLPVCGFVTLQGVGGVRWLGTFGWSGFGMIYGLAFWSDILFGSVVGFRVCGFWVLCWCFRCLGCLVVAWVWVCER